MEVNTPSERAFIALQQHPCARFAQESGTGCTKAPSFPYTRSEARRCPRWAREARRERRGSGADRGAEGTKGRGSGAGAAAAPGGGAALRGRERGSGSGHTAAPRPPVGSASGSGDLAASAQGGERTPPPPSPSELQPGTRRAGTAWKRSLTETSVPSLPGMALPPPAAAEPCEAEETF